VFRIDRHELGPRLYVLGHRIHECHAGLVLIGAAAVLAVDARGHPGPAAVCLVVGTWLLWKDWRDLSPRLRDKSAWSPGRHRPPTPLRSRARAHWLAPFAAICTAAMGVVNIGSALTPGVASRMHLLLQLVPREIPVAAHALALSAGVALAILGFYLYRRRRRAWALAVAVLLISGALNVLKGLDVEEGAACWVLASLLIWGRDAFPVVHRDVGWRSPLLRTLTLLAGACATSALTLIAAAHWGSAALTPGSGLAELKASLTLGTGPIHYRDPFDWVPIGVALLWTGAALAVAWILFRPLAAPRGLPAMEMRPLAQEIVERHGSDTLSFFKLRGDKHHFFDSAHHAFVGYRVDGGVLLVSGDPIGPPGTIPGLLRELCDFAGARGLALAALGASEAFATVAAGAGLSSFYIGDEAIVDVQSFSLEGRAIRKVRQAVARVRKAGFHAELRPVGDLSESELVELEELSDRWRGADPERGFSMTVDGLRGEQMAGTLLLIGRDAGGVARGFLHFVPCYGRQAMSLGLMRRDRDSVNGLTEYLVVSAIEMLGERGIEEVSLNFAAFARLLRTPNGLLERALGRVVAIANPYFQIESLYRFNAKFSPRWQARYLLYERGPLGFTRAGLAAMWAEGQLPRPRWTAPVPRARAGAPVAAIES
jgi:lysyl-tRNA synthetase, class II